MGFIAADLSLVIDTISFRHSVLRAEAGKVGEAEDAAEAVDLIVAPFAAAILARAAANPPPDAWGAAYAVVLVFGRVELPPPIPALGCLDATAAAAAANPPVGIVPALGAAEDAV